MSKINQNHETLVSLVKISTLISTLANRFFSKFKINPAQFNILMTLNQFEEGLSQRDLSDKLILTKSNMVGLIDNLEKYKFVKRTASSTDRRFNYINLTEEGKKFLKGIEKEYFDEVDQLINNLNSEEKDNINNSMEKLGSYLTEKLK